MALRKQSKEDLDEMKKIFDVKIAKLQSDLQKETSLMVKNSSEQLMS